MSSNAQILQKQQETTNQLNALIEQSAEAISCGPDCQKLKSDQDLEQKYLDAQTNMQTAPIQLQEARKNFYVFTEGEGAYNSLMESELKLKATKISELIKAKFLEEITSATTLNFYYNTDIINSKNSIELYNTYFNKNKETEVNIRNSNGDALTNDRKSFYEIQEMDNLDKWYSIFIWIYYLLLLGLFLGSIFIKNQLTIIKKVGLMVVLLFYPVYIERIVAFFVSILQKINLYLFPKNVYK